MVYWTDELLNLEAKKEKIWTIFVKLVMDADNNG